MSVYQRYRTKGDDKFVAMRLQLHWITFLIFQGVLIGIELVRLHFRP
jgi:hypothetical protein